MRKIPLIHTAATVGKIIFSIMQVFSAISAVFLLLATLSLSFLPAGSLEVETGAEVTMNFHLNKIIEGDFAEYRDLLISGMAGAEKTEDGFAVVEKTTETLENRLMALTLIPSLTQMIVMFFFYRALKRICSALKDSPLSPFSPEMPELIKNFAYTIFVLALAPWGAASLIQMITRVSTDISLEMGTILWGFLALALAEIFRTGANLTPRPFGQNDPNQTNGQNFTPPGAF